MSETYDEIIAAHMPEPDGGEPEAPSAEYDDGVVALPEDDGAAVDLPDEAVAAGWTVDEESGVYVHPAGVVVDPDTGTVFNAHTGEPIDPTLLEHGDPAQFIDGNFAPANQAEQYAVQFPGVFTGKTSYEIARDLANTPQARAYAAELEAQRAEHDQEAAAPVFNNLVDVEAQDREVDRRKVMTRAAEIFQDFVPEHGFVDAGTEAVKYATREQLGGVTYDDIINRHLSKVRGQQ